MTPHELGWEDDSIDPLKGPKGDTQFLRDNYKLMAVGGSFQTVKSRFSIRQIHAGAEKAGFIVRVDDLDPWLKVTIIGKV